MASQRATSKSIHKNKGPSKLPTSKISKHKPRVPPPQGKKSKVLNGPRLRTKRQRVYTDEELEIHKLNNITPIGVQKPQGKKKGKVFVDDAETMQTILAMVNAEKEGQIESKMMRARKMEEIREARRIETEAKEQRRKSLLESKKEELRKRRKKRPALESSEASKLKFSRQVKRVSFD